MGKESRALERIALRARLNHSGDCLCDLCFCRYVAVEALTPAETVTGAAPVEASTECACEIPWPSLYRGKGYPVCRACGGRYPTGSAEASAGVATDRKPSIGDIWRHEATGNLYRVLLLGTWEPTVTESVIYESQDGSGTKVRGRIWVRPLSVFMDGRFTLAETPAAQSPATGRYDEIVKELEAVIDWQSAGPRIKHLCRDAARYLREAQQRIAELEAKR